MHYFCLLRSLSVLGIFVSVIYDIHNSYSLQGFGMPLAGYLIHWIGPRPAIATGCLIFSCGTALTYFTLNTVSSSSFTRPFLIIFFSSFTPTFSHILLCNYSAHAYFTLDMTRCSGIGEIIYSYITAIRERHPLMVS